GVDKLISQKATITPYKPTGKWGIYDEDGIHIDDYFVLAVKYNLTPQSFGMSADKYYELRNTYVFNDQDSLDPTYPFETDFQIVSEMTAIQSVKLSFKIRNFRAYSTGVPSGGGHTTPSGGGHTTP
ncbi:unnamed protein product, partial [marine sediment metagenome]